MAALAAGHLSRVQEANEASEDQHGIYAAILYTAAIGELSQMLSDQFLCKSDSVLATCLLLCIYEVRSSQHLEQP